MQLEQANTTSQVIFPYVYGSMAFSMGKRSQNYTHKWICYVRGLNNQNMSYLIKKVVFNLHASFENPIRELYQPPYEIQELGWGQFEIMIQIHFNHPNMPYVQVPHMLKLHQMHSTGSQAAKRPLCSEVYDQIVFTQKDEFLDKILKDKQQMSSAAMVDQDQNNGQEVQMAQMDQPLKSITKYSKYFLTFDAEDHRIKLEDALRFIKGEIVGLEDRMRNADLDIQKVYEDLYGKVL